MTTGYVYSWTGKTSDSFNQAKNWYNSTAGATATAVPGTSDEALVAATGTLVGPGNVFDLALTGTATGLTAGGALAGSYVFVGGTVTLATGTELSSANLIDIGDGSSNTLAQRVPTLLTVGAGATLYAYADQAGGLDILVGQQGGTGTLAVDGAQAIATSGAEGFWVGDGGTGAITVAAGGVVYGGTSGSEPGSLGLVLGSGGGSGVVTATGTGSEIAFGNILEAGAGGTGSLAVSAGAVLLAGDGQTSLITGADTATSSGAATVSGATAVLYGVLEDGAIGQGSVSVVNTSNVLVTSTATSGAADQWSVLIGTDSSGAGTLTVAGGSIMSTIHGIAVGSEGTGTVSVTGAILAIDQLPGSGLTALAVGLAAGTSGVVNVTGGDIYDENSAGMIVGAFGNGALTINAAGSIGGTVVAGTTSGVALTLGAAAGSTGTVSVNGTNSAFYVSGQLTDGALGAGMIDVTSGAVLTAGTDGGGIGLAVGGNGGSGALAVSGGGAVNVYGQTSIGDGSTGAMTVGTGGHFTDVAVSTTALVLGVEAGVTGNLLITDAGTSANLVGGLAIGVDGTGIFTLQNGARFYVGNYAGESAPGIVLGAGGGSAGTLAIENGATFKAATGLAVGSDGAGLLTVSDATLTIATAAGAGLNAIGAGLSAGVTGTIDIAGGTVNDSDQAGVVLGAFGTGNLSITASGSQGGTLLTGDPGGAAGLSLGIATGASGAASVSGAGSVLTVDGTISDGASGAGAIAISAQATLNAGFATTATALALGGVGGSGLVSIATGAGVSAMGQTIVGEYGTGTLSVTGGSSFSDTASGFEALVLGSGTSSGGSLLVSDAGSAVTLAGGLEDGVFGASSVTIQNGATVTASTTSGNGLPGVVISESDGVSALIVTGSGSELSDTGQMQVGGTLSSGAGVLEISSGATVSVALAQGQSIEAATIGGAAGAPLSSAVVGGAGSDWAIGGGLQIGGGGGAAQLYVKAGGTVTATSVALDTLGTATEGRIVVTGAGASVTTGALSVGSSTSSGVLQVSDGGLFDVTGATSLFGTATLSGGTMNFIGAIDGTGTLAIGGGGALVLGASEASGLGIDFTAGGGTLSAATSSDIAGTITGWSTGDFIALDAQTVASDSYANGTLTLLDSNNATLGVLHFAGALSTASFSISHPAGGETLIAFGT